MTIRTTRRSPARSARRARSAIALAALAATLATGLSGCVSGRFRDTYPKPNAETGDYARSYPDLAKGDTVDVQVFRTGRRIRFTNTTADALGPGTLWINERYSRPIDAIEPGQSVQMGLRDFRDEYGEAINAGGFFATRDPELVVLVELEPSDAASTDARFTRLVVVENDVD